MKVPRGHVFKTNSAALFHTRAQLFVSHLHFTWASRQTLRKTWSDQRRCTASWHARSHNAILRRHVCPRARPARTAGGNLRNYESTSKVPISVRCSPRQLSRTSVLGLGVWATLAALASAAQIPQKLRYPGTERRGHGTSLATKLEARKAEAATRRRRRSPLCKRESSSCNHQGGIPPLSSLREVESAGNAGNGLGRWRTKKITT